MRCAVELRPYQREARDRVLAELERVRATLLVLPTGLGKTVVFGAVAQHFVGLGARVLVLAHRGELLEQAAATLERFGLTVGIEQGDRRAGDAQVVIASVQTMRRKRLESFAPDAFGLVVIDEAHHAAAPSYRAVLEHFAAAKVLGVTATPDRTDGVGLGNVFDSLAHRMEIAAGIRAGWLAPIALRSVVVEGLDLSEVRVVAGDFVANELEAKLVDARALLEVAAPLAELAAGRQTLAFVVGVRQAHALAEVLRVRGVRAAALDGCVPREARAEVLADYRAGRLQVVCNAMLLTEGFDAPETSCIALVRPTRSRSLIAQMIGRGTRLAEGKTSCLVVDFVPERAGSIRLAAPADALAGEELPDAIAARVRDLSRSGEQLELEGLIERARAEEAAEQEAARAVEAARREAAAARRRELIAHLGVVYAAPTMPLAELLAEVAPPKRDPFGWPERRATEAQLEALRKAGIEVPDELTAREASALFDVLRARRDAGLCSFKQAKQLRRFGLRDEVTFEHASEALSAIAANGWKPPSWLYRDPRFARGEVAA